MKTMTLTLISLIITNLIAGCGKDFLEVKPDKSLLVPVTLSDFQAILDNNGIMNKAPSLPLIASDEYQVDNNGLNLLNTPLERNTYLWAKDPYATPAVSDWDLLYQQVFYANIVLEGLQKKGIDQQSKAYRNIRGAALFYRAIAFFQLAQVFSPAYTQSNANATLGVPVRLKADVNQRSVRSSLQQTYDQVINDLGLALPLLDEVTTIKTRPSQWATLALLSKVYLTMGNYMQAEKYADDCLKISKTLIDFNTLDKNAFLPFPPALPGPNVTGNLEVIFYSSFISYSYIRPTSAFVTVNPDLYQSYVHADLRKQLFFTQQSSGVINFKGSLAGNNNTSLFGGLAIDEIYLIKAECQIRNGNINNAMIVLNNLLKSRWVGQIREADQPADQKHALKLILDERKKELFARGTRWQDLKRYNLENDLEQVLYRNINGLQYQLNPNDKRYVFTIPDSEIQLSGITQNER